MMSLWGCSRFTRVIYPGLMVPSYLDDGRSTDVAGSEARSCDTGNPLVERFGRTEWDILSGRSWRH
jgi:hypothetical protein